MSGSGWPRLLLLVAVLALVFGCTRLRAPAQGSIWPPYAHPEYARLSRADLLIESQRKAIMGRKTSHRDVRRVARQIGPLVAESVRQPEVTRALQALARAQGVSPEVLRAELQRLQEADLLLESGGDPNAVSPAGAAGVAQWLASTAREAGLRVDMQEYARVMARIRAVNAALAQSQSRPADWRAPRTLGGPSLSRAQWIAAYQAELRDLEQQRLAADERFDPRKAIFAQSRHLVRAWARFGSLDWALQAYHGGQRGVERTVSYYLGQALSFPASRLPSFEQVYFGISPRSRAEAFSYVYGRSDDHRYYWWRVLAAERALALFRANADHFRQGWLSLTPGYPLDRAWYPDALKDAFADVAALQAAYKAGKLAPLPDDAARYGFAPRAVAPLDPANERWYRGVRPEVLGMLLRVVDTYRAEGGRAPLRVTGAASTVAYAHLEAEKKAAEEAAKAGAARVPPAKDAKAPEGDPMDLPPQLEEDPPLSLHAVGLGVDIARPEDAGDRKVLEYALGQLSDRMRIAWLRDGAAAYHLCPNPAFAREMRATAERVR